MAVRRGQDAPLPCLIVAHLTARFDRLSALRLNHSTVRATRKGAELFLAETKSMLTTATSGRGFSRVLFQRQIEASVLLAERLSPPQATSAWPGPFLSAGRPQNHQFAKSWP